MKRKFIACFFLASLIAVTSIVIAFWNVEPAADFTAEQFHDEYKDWKAANMRFVGQSLAIRGEVLFVEHSWLTPHGWVTVALGQGGKGVICHFPPGRVYQARRLAPGDTAVVRGVCQGEFCGCPILSDCVFEGSWLPNIGIAWELWE